MYEVIVFYYNGVTEKFLTDTPNKYFVKYHSDYENVRTVIVSKKGE